MGSLLNFVFLSDKLEKNGADGFSIQGPLYWYIVNNKLSYTLNGILKPEYKNILMIEGLDSLHSFTHIPLDILNYINNNDVKLLAVSLADPTSYDVYIQTKLILETILPNKFYILDSNTSLLKCFTIDYFLEEATYPYKKISNFNIQTELGYVSEEINICELDTFRNKKFLSFNRTVDKHHRASLLHEYLTNDYSDSYFSFLNLLEYLGEIPNIGFIADKYDFYNSQLPIELDTQFSFNKHGFNTSGTFKKELFLNSCINIVTETSFYMNELFISEKVLKPILMYQPFIMIGPYRYLKRLKTYGFKTFSEFWNEEYDEIKNSNDRIKIIINLIHELNKKSIDELNELYKKTKDICIYNRKLLDSLELDSFPEIFKQIENEW
jgi:hypothetical protein